jgi:hypothetical protein
MTAPGYAILILAAPRAGMASAAIPPPPSASAIASGIGIGLAILFATLTPGAPGAAMAISITGPSFIALII